MLTNTPAAAATAPVYAPPSVPMLRWIFRRGTKALTCEVAAVSGGYEVCVVPHWNVAASTIESFVTPVQAFAHHARIARRLQEGAWAVDRVPVIDDGDHAVQAA
jgi:hypothetical protein